MDKCMICGVPVRFALLIGPACWVGSVLPWQPHSGYPFLELTYGLHPHPHNHYPGPLTKEPTIRRRAIQGGKK